MTYGYEGPPSPTSTSSDESSASTEQAWDTGDRVLYAGDLAWLLKELSWILIVPHVAIPAGLVACGCAFWAACMHATSPVESLVPEVVNAIWLTSNVIWMSNELLWDSPDEQTPWALTPLLATDETTYDNVQMAVKAGFALGPMVYLACLTCCVVRWALRPSLRHKRSMLAMLLSSYLGTWCLKDFFWAEEALWPSLLCDLSTLSLVVLSASVYSGRGLRGVDSSDAAWLVWILSNACWVLCELQYDDSLTWRYASAGFSLTAFLLMCCSYRQVKRRALRSAAYNSADDGLKLTRPANLPAGLAL